MMRVFCFGLLMLVSSHVLVASDEIRETLFGQWSSTVVGTDYNILPSAPFKKFFICTMGCVAGAAAVSLTPMLAPLVPGSLYAKSAVALGSTLLGIATVKRRAKALDNAFENHKLTIGARKKVEMNYTSLMTDAFMWLFVLPATIGALGTIVKYRGFPV
jgi:hypothetical protein